MKVLLLSHTYVVSVNQQKVEALARQKGIELQLVIPDKWRSVLRFIHAEKVEAPQYKIHSLPAYVSGNNDRFIYQPLQLADIFRKFKPDLVHIEEEPWSASCFQASFMAKLVGAKSLFFTWENLRRTFRPHYRALLQSSFRLNSGALAGNHEAREVLTSQGFPGPIEILPQLGVELDYYKRVPLPKDLTLGFIGRFDSQKGIMTLLEAYATLPQKPRLLLVGGGYLKEEMSSFIAEHNLGNSVELIENVPHDEIPKVLARMSALILPSLTTPVWKEQFGHVLIEAMSMGRVVIGSSSGAIPEVIEEGGLIFGEGNHNDLANKIQLLYDSTFFKSTAEKGYQRVINHYTNDTIAEKTVAFYHHILGKSANN